MEARERRVSNRICHSAVLWRLRSSYFMAEVERCVCVLLLAFRLLRCFFHFNMSNQLAQLDTLMLFNTYIPIQKYCKPFWTDCTVQITTGQTIAFGLSVKHFNTKRELRFDMIWQFNYFANENRMFSFTFWLTSSAVSIDLLNQFSGKSAIIKISPG